MVRTLCLFALIVASSATYSHAQTFYSCRGSNYSTGYVYGRNYYYQPYYYQYYPSPQELHYYNLKLYMAERNMRMAMYAQMRAGQERRAEENKIKNQKMADYHRRHGNVK